jgi:hypothetical protein
MGQRQKFIEKIVYEKYPKYKHPKLKKAELYSSDFFDLVANVYYDLDGQFTDVPVNYGSWDISTTKFIIELDKERHFNRYRLQILSSSFYTDWSYFSLKRYQEYCINKEKECLTTAGYGGYWKNESTEKMFLKSNVVKNLSGNGSSRWKQRAYYDFLKDVTSKIRGIPVVRISIYEIYKGKTLNYILINEDKDSLISFLNEKRNLLI